MKNVILDFIKGVGVSTVLRAKETDGQISSILLDFLGKDDNYYSFFAGYNSTQIFFKPTSDYLLGKGNQLDNRLQNNLLSFNSKLAYMEGKWNSDSGKILEKQLLFILDGFRKTLLGYRAFSNFKIVDVVIETKFMIGLIIYLKYFDVYVDPIVYNFSTNNKVLVKAEEDDLIELVDLFRSAGISNVELEAY